MVSAYALTFDASKHIKFEFEDALETPISHRNIGNVLVTCANANASLGRNNINFDAHVSAIGPYGINSINTSGRRLRSFLELGDLALLSSFVKNNIMVFGRTLTTNYNTC
jgi:hypothetical protein